MFRVLSLVAIVWYCGVKHISDRESVTAKGCQDHLCIEFGFRSAEITNPVQ